MMKSTYRTNAHWLLAVALVACALALMPVDALAATDAATGGEKVEALTPAAELDANLVDEDVDDSGAPAVAVGQSEHAVESQPSDSGENVADVASDDSSLPESSEPVTDEIGNDVQADAAAEDADGVEDEVALEEAPIAETAVVDDQNLDEADAETLGLQPASTPALMTLRVATPVAKAKTSGKWVVSKDYGHGLQRYWVQADGSFAKSRLITPEDGDDAWWAYARPEGYVVRGKYVAKDGKVYLANNDGLLEGPGWVVSNKYDGSYQRYWIDEDAHAAKPGYSDDGWDHYTRPEGYVVRGKYVAKGGNVYLANNDGKLEAPGWVVSNKYDGGSYQRYWIDAKAHGAIPGYSEDGWAHYTIPQKGYVARGSFTDSAGRRMLADNDGRVRGGIPKVRNGWVVTNEFGHGTQRYWFRNDVMAKGELLSASEAGWWAYARPEGFVVRGKYVAKDGYIYLANNDGKLENPGWVVSNKYGDGTQRYYIESGPHAAVPGFSKNGWAHYTLPNKGYVVRGKSSIGSHLVLADNDGRIETATGWLVTSKYDGHNERYYMERKNGYSAAKLGLFKVSGKQYFGIDGKGYVVRNSSVLTGGKWYHGNNDGVLTYLKSGKIGWQNPAGYYQVSAYTVVLPDYSSGIFAYVTPSRIKPEATRAEVVEAFIARAYDYMGTGYEWNYACAPGVGVDCAGLVLQCMYAVGITPNKYTPHDHYNTPGHDHYANDMYYDPKILKVPLANRQRGDLIYYPGHIGIYLGNNQMIHAYPSSVHVASIYFSSSYSLRNQVGRLFV